MFVCFKPLPEVVRFILTSLTLVPLPEYRVPLSASSNCWRVERRPGMRRKRKENDFYPKDLTKLSCAMWEKSVPKWWIFIVFLAGKRKDGIYCVKWFNRLFDANLRLELR